MSNSLVSVLHTEERAIVAELRASKPFQRLEAIRRLLALYDVQPSVTTGLDGAVAAEPDRATGEVIHFAATATATVPPAAPIHVPPAAPVHVPPAAPQAAMSAASTQATVRAIPMPAPSAAAAMAEAAVADVVVRSPAPAMPAVEMEAASVVSSVRAALLGIGRG